MEIMQKYYYKVSLLDGNTNKLDFIFDEKIYKKQNFHEEIHNDFFTFVDRLVCGLSSDDKMLLFDSFFVKNDKLLNKIKSFMNFERTAYTEIINCNLKDLLLRCSPVNEDAFAFIRALKDKNINFDDSRFSIRSKPSENEYIKKVDFSKCHYIFSVAIYPCWLSIYSKETDFKGWEELFKKYKKDNMEIVFE